MIQSSRYGNPAYFTNRELSWLLFNKRVLSEARDTKLPLFERLKFLSITASNLDEFFMVRIASLKDMVTAGYSKKDIAGMTAQEQLDALGTETHELVAQQYSTYNRSLLPLLAKNGLKVVEQHEDLDEEDGRYVDRYFEENIYPVLTPMAVDSSRPFPLIRNKTLNIGALVKKKKGSTGLEIAKGVEFATVQVPSGLPRIIELPSKDVRKVILLEEIIERNMDKLFLNYDIVCSCSFRIMRDADFTIDEDEAADLLEEIEKKLKKRQWGQAIRLEVEAGIDKKLVAAESPLAAGKNDIAILDAANDRIVVFRRDVYGAVLDSDFHRGSLSAPLTWLQSHVTPLLP